MLPHTSESKFCPQCGLIKAITYFPIVFDHEGNQSRSQYCSSCIHQGGRLGPTQQEAELIAEFLATGRSIEQLDKSGSLTEHKTQKELAEAERKKERKEERRKEQEEKEQKKKSADNENSQDINEQIIAGSRDGLSKTSKIAGTLSGGFLGARHGANAAGTATSTQTNTVVTQKAASDNHQADLTNANQKTDKTASTTTTQETQANQNNGLLSNKSLFNQADQTSAASTNAQTQTTGVSREGGLFTTARQNDAATKKLDFGIDPTLRTQEAKAPPTAKSAEPTSELPKAVTENLKYIPPGGFRR